MTFLFVVIWQISMLVSQDAVAIRIQTHENFLQQQHEQGAIDLKDVRAVFGAVFQALPDEVKVWPSGNYYYFSYLQDGAIRRGNFRLDAVDRDRGVIHFAFDSNGKPGLAAGRAFDRTDGVKVTRVLPLVYVVHFQGKAVVFRLNDLSDVAPDDMHMRAGETYLGAIADESGFGFFLLWDQAASVFLYILDESRLIEPLENTVVSDQVKIGRRSGFAFYRDRYRPRWILIGVREADVAANSYFDGPFDQMPDNTIRGDVLKQALEKSRPDLAGRIDRFGNSADLRTRVLVRPYILYSKPEQLSGFDGCAARAGRPVEYYRCFSSSRAP